MGNSFRFSGGFDKKRKNGIVKFSHSFEDIDSVVSHLIFLSTIIFWDANSSENVEYFPASRSGFMQTYKKIASSSMRDELKNSTSLDTKLKLPLPVIDFLEKITFSKREEKNDFNEILESMRKILDGNIKVTGEDVLSYFFRPEEDKDIKLEMQISSSLVAELTPILYSLTDGRNKFFIIEEPEGHLHPEAQIQLARVFGLMINAGHHLLITTHSDYIWAELNNLIYAGSLTGKFREEAKKRFGYEEEELLDYQKVGAYLFKHKPDSNLFSQDEKTTGTTVEELEVTEKGIPDTNFINAFDNLFKRMADLEELQRQNKKEESNSD